jgi:hypothetical protein
MINSDHCDLIRIDLVVDTVGKPPHNYPPHPFKDNSCPFRYPPDAVKGLLNTEEKFISQALTLSVIPSFCLSEILFRFRTDDER